MQQSYSFAVRNIAKAQFANGISLPISHYYKFCITSWKAYIFIIATVKPVYIGFPREWTNARLIGAVR